MKGNGRVRSDHRYEDHWSWSVTWRRGYDMYLKILHVNDDFKIKFSPDAAGRQDAAATAAAPIS